MNEILLKIIPLVLIFVLGYLLKVIGLFKKESADLLMKIIFYITAPALILISIPNIKLSLELIYLPLAPLVTIILMFLIAFFSGKLLHLSRQTLGTFLVGLSILNTGFLLPFFLNVYGEEGLARVLIFDFGNAILTFTFAYLLACKYGKKKSGAKLATKKIFLSPPIWALVIGIVLNLTKLEIPSLAINFLQPLGNLFIPLVMLALGIYFTPKIIKFAPLLTAITIRIVLGLLIGLAIVKVFNVEGLTKLVIIAGASAPIGYNTLTFAALEKLDREFAASLVSISVGIGLIFTPLLMIIFS